MRIDECWSVLSLPKKQADWLDLGAALPYPRKIITPGLRSERATWCRGAGPPRWTVREAVTLTASEALSERVIDIVSPDIPDLLA